MTKRLTPKTDYGLFKCGEKNRNAKLTEEKVRLIKMLLRLGNRQWSIAEIFDVNQYTISMINTKKTWRWLE